MDDGWNCGTLWCLFMHNIMQQYNVLYNFEFDKKAQYLLLLNLGIGRMWVQPSLFGQHMKRTKVSLTKNVLQIQKHHKQVLYKRYYEDMIIMWERLKRLCVETRAHNDGDIIEFSKNWGEVPSYYTDFTKNLKNKFGARGNKIESSALKKELEHSAVFARDAGTIAPSTMFLMPNKDLLDHYSLDKWFPQLENLHLFAKLSQKVSPFDWYQYSDHFDVTRNNLLQVKYSQLKIPKLL